MLATGVALGVSVVACVGVYLGLRYSLYREVDGFLIGEVHEFRAILTQKSNDDLKEIEQKIRAEIGSRSNNDLVFRLLDLRGNLLITSDSNDQFANPWNTANAPTELPGADVRFDTIDDDRPGMPYRVCSQRERLPVHGDVIIQAAYHFDRVSRSLAMTRVLCFAVLVITAVLSILGGRAVARSSMMPVVNITRIARQIDAKQLSTRVPLAGTNDELDTLADTLNNMLDRVQQSFRQIQQFTADAAHELRTPLTALRGSAEHALSQPRSEKQLRAVIEKSLEYYRLLSRVTDDLLLLARLNAGQEPLQFEEFSLNRAVDDVVDLYRPLAAEHNVELTWRADSDQVVVVGDSGKIRRVLSNLLDNSIKYMGGPGSIDLSLSQQNGMVSIVVNDTGPGIPPKDLPHLFERFYRGDRARTASGNAANRSAGLGLAICQSIVHAHGGEIAVESKTNRGTTVSVHLHSAGTASRPSREAKSRWFVAGPPNKNGPGTGTKADFQ